MRCCHKCCLNFASFISDKAAVFIFIFTFILNYAREEDKWAHMRCCRCIRILQIAFSGKAAVFIFIFTFILNDAREEVKMGTYEMLPKMLPQFCKFQFKTKLPSLGVCRRCRLHKILAITAIAHNTGIAKIHTFTEYPGEKNCVILNFCYFLLIYDLLRGDVL